MSTSIWIIAISLVVLAAGALILGFVFLLRVFEGARVIKRNRELRARVDKALDGVKL